MDEAIVTLQLQETLKRLREHRLEAMVQMGAINITIIGLEELISDIDKNWNGSHPVGQS